MAETSRDRLVGAFYEDGALYLQGRRGNVEFAYPDGFYVSADDAAKFSSRWNHFIHPAKNGFAFVEWPERIRKGGSRRGRLGFFNSEEFKPNGIKPLEADIDPVKRFLAERKGLELASDWRILYVDLETKKIKNWSKVHETRVLSFSWLSSGGGKGHVRLKADDDRAERDLLDTFSRIASRHDIIVAWNGDRFDFKILVERMELHGVPFDDRLCHFIDHLRIFRRYWLKTEDGAITSSLALDAVGDALLGMRKVPLEDRARALGFDGKGDLFTWAWLNAPELHREYNDQDVEIMAAIEEKTRFIALHLQVCQICRVLPGPSSLYPLTLIDGKMLQRGAEAGYHFPSRMRDDEEPHFVRAKGAYVPEAVIGLHESVAVVDFARMYVSIIRSGNMSLETIDPAGDIEVPETTETGQLTGRVIARFRSDPVGHLPYALGEIVEARKATKKLIKEAESGSVLWLDLKRIDNAWKVLGNMFYGGVLTPFSRYHVQEMGEAITSIGRLLLARTMELVKKRGHRIIAGDTDAVDFIATDDEAAAVRDQANGEMIPEILSKIGVKRPDVKVEYEKRYLRVVFTASKRYAGLYAVFDGQPVSTDKPADVKGLEIVRSDVCRATRALQREVVDRLLRGASIEELGKILEKRKVSFVAGETPLSELVLTKGLTKKLDEYAGKQQHVEVAKRMVENGIPVDEGAKIPFVLTVDGPVHPTELGDLSKVDLVSYWNDHVYEPTRRVLEAAYPDHPWVVFEIQTQKKKPAHLKLLENQNDLFGFKRPLILVIDEAFPEASANRLKMLLGAFPGEHAVELHVKCPSERKVFEMTVAEAIKVRRPEDDARFAQGLRTLCVRWK